MNRNQRVLTILAVVAFGTIIFFHYNRVIASTPSTSGYQEIKHWTVVEKSNAIINGLKVIHMDGPDAGKPVERIDISKLRDEWEDAATFDYLNRHKEWVRVEHPALPARSARLIREPEIQDVRMPLFALAVFYAGLFFILATPTGRKS